MAQDILPLLLPSPSLRVEPSLVLILLPPGSCTLLLKSLGSNVRSRLLPLALLSVALVLRARAVSTMLVVPLPLLLLKVSGCMLLVMLVSRLGLLVRRAQEVLAMLAALLETWSAVVARCLVFGVVVGVVVAVFVIRGLH